MKLDFRCGRSSWSSKDLGDKSPVVKLMSKDGLIGERVQSGFLGSMGKAALDAGRAQVGVGSGGNAGIDKPLRNIGNYQKSDEYDDTGKEHSKQRIEGCLDI